MPTNTTRLSLVIPASTDNESLFPSQATTTYGILDNSTIVTEGTLAARPTTGTVEHNRLYHATDTAQWFVSDGTNWNLLHINGAWATLSLGTGTVQIGYTPSSRFEGDIVRLKGSIQNNSGSSMSSGTTLATLAAAYRPSVNLTLPSNVETASQFISVTIASATGVIAANTSLANGGTVNLDGITYSLS